MSKMTTKVDTKFTADVTVDVTTELTVNYIREEDLTIVWQLMYISEELIQRTLVGWYHGMPNDRDTKSFSHLNVMAQYLWD